MKIREMDNGNFLVTDKRTKIHFTATTKERVKIGLKKRGYRKNATGRYRIIPGDIIIDEEYPSPAPS